MKYPRYAYKDPAVKTKTIKIQYSASQVEAPVFDYPITPRENFIRSMKRENMLWAPNAFSEMQNLGAQDVVTERMQGRLIHTDFRNRRQEENTFIDWFNSSWTWVDSAGGPMLTPGTKAIEDIADWERELVWPDLSQWDFEDTAARFIKEEYDPELALNIDVGRGITERMISLVGGYTEGMLAFASEPEAVKAFNERYADHVIALFDKLHSLYPVNSITYHDDWGTERDTFFSEKMMEDMVFAPTKKIIDHIHSKGVYFILHSCGNITRFVPYMIDMHADLLQVQRRAVDIPELKRKYGNKIGFNSGFEGLDFGVETTKEHMTEIIRKSVDLLAPGGAYLASLFSVNDPEMLWHTLGELYAYSRELYDEASGN